MEALNRYWWEAPKTRVEEEIFGVVRFLMSNQTYRREMNLRHLRLYGNVNVLGLAAGAVGLNNTFQNQTERVTLNIVQSMCDTVTQKIAKNNPKPTFVTEGGDYTKQKKAKLLNQFVQGVFYSTDFYEKAPEIFRDATIFGTGAIKVYREGTEIKTERVFMDELLVDDQEAIYGDPRCLYQTKSIPREILVKMFPAHTSKIMAAPKADSVSVQHSNLSNQVFVVEAWHLPFKDQDGKLTGGRHCICIENQTLVDEEWKRTRFPFVFQRWNKRPVGFFGQGIAEQLTGLQIEINKILRTIQVSFHLLGVPKYLLEQGSKIIKAHLNNEIGGLLWYSGMKPEVYTPSPVAGELFQHLFWLYQRAYEIIGVSQLSAQSKKPDGLNSGKALRTYDDIESERFILVGKSWEAFHLEAAKHMIELGKEIYAEAGEFAVKVKGKKFLEKIDWAEIDLQEDEYIMQCFPTAFLASTPAGRLQDIQEYMQAGFIDKVTGQRLLDFPDLEAHTARVIAPQEDIEAQIEKIIDKGEYDPPEPFQDLAYGLATFTSAYLQAKNNSVPEERLELLRRWMTEANAQLNPPPPPIDPNAAPPMGAPMAGGMPGAMPLAAPMPAPRSDMLPNAPTAAGGHLS